MGGSAAMPAAVSIGAAAGASVGSPAKALVPASPAAVRAPPVAHGTPPAASAGTSSAVAPPLPGTPLAAAPAAVPAASASPPPEAAAAPAAAAAPRSPKELQTKRDRCWTCKKKTGLTGFECRCGFVFCGTHRYADEVGGQIEDGAALLSVLSWRRVGIDGGGSCHGLVLCPAAQPSRDGGKRPYSTALPLPSYPHLQHACTFDYVAHDRGVLDKRNPKVVGDKLGEKV